MKIVCAMLICLFIGTAPSRSEKLAGTIRLGGIMLDEEAGSLSAMQETYNIYDDFSITQINLHGSAVSQSYFSLNLSNINLDNRAVDFNFRVPGYLRMYSKYDQNRYV